MYVCMHTHNSFSATRSSNCPADNDVIALLSIYLDVYIHACVFTSMYVYMYVCAHILICTCMYV